MHNDVWRSNDKGYTWNLVAASAPWQARAYHFCVELNDSLFVMGGQGGDGLFEFFDDIWRSDDLGVTWTNVVEHAPFGKRAGGYGFVYDGEIYVLGGAYCTEFEFPCNLRNRHYFDDIWKSADGIHWQQIAKNLTFVQREGIIVVIKDNVFYAFGGDDGFERPHNDVWKSSDKGQTWQLLVEHAAWSERTGQVGVLYGEYIVMIGGYPDLTDMWRSKDGIEWEQISTSCWNCAANKQNCGKFDFEFFVYDDVIYTIAGDQEVKAPIPQDNDVWSYYNSSLL